MRKYLKTRWDSSDNIRLSLITCNSGQHFAGEKFPVWRHSFHNREIKLDVTWSYVKRQTAKMTSEFLFFSSNPSLNHIKIKKMYLTIHDKYKYFHSTVHRAKDRRQKFHFCRLPRDVRPRNVKRNLSNVARWRETVSLLDVMWPWTTSQ